MVLYTLILQFYLKNGQYKKKRYLSKEKKQWKQNSADIMIFVDGKETVFQVKLTLQVE